MNTLGTGTSTLLDPGISSLYEQNIFINNEPSQWVLQRVLKGRKAKKRWATAKRYKNNARIHKQIKRLCSWYKRLEDGEVIKMSVQGRVSWIMNSATLQGLREEIGNAANKNTYSQIG